MLNQASLTDVVSVNQSPTSVRCVFAYYAKIGQQARYMPERRLLQHLHENNLDTIQIIIIIIQCVFVDVCSVLFLSCLYICVCVYLY